MAISTFEFSFPRSFLVKAYQKRFSPNVIEYSASYITSEYEWKRCALTTINPDRLSKQNQLQCQLQIPYESEAHSKEGKICIQLRNLSVDIVNSEIHLNLHDLSDTPYRDDDASFKQTPTIDELDFALPFSCIEKIVRNRGGSIYRSEAWYLGLSGVVLPCMLNATEMLTDNGEERLQLVFEGLILSNSISPFTLKFMAASANRPKQQPSSTVSMPVIVSSSALTVPCSTNTLQQVHPITIRVPPPSIGFNLSTNPMIPTIPMMPAMQAFSISQVIPTQNNPHITVTAGSILQVTTSGRVIDSTITSTSSAGPTETQSDESYRSLVHIEEIIAKDFSPKDDSDVCEPINLSKNREESPDLLGKIIEETILKDTDSDNSLDRILAGNPTFSERDIIKTGNDVETAVMQSMASDGTSMMDAPRVEISQGSHYVNTGGIVSEAFIMANSMVDSDDELLITHKLSKTETKPKNARRNTSNPRSKNPKKQSRKSTDNSGKEGRDSSVKGKEKNNPLGSGHFNEGIELLTECVKDKYSYSADVREKTFIQSIENDNTLSMANSSTINTQKPKADMGKFKAKSSPKFRKIRPRSPFIEIPSEATFVGLGECVKQNDQEEKLPLEPTAIGRLKAKSGLKSMMIRSNSPIIEIPSEASFIGIGESVQSKEQKEEKRFKECDYGTVSGEVGDSQLESESEDKGNPTENSKEDQQSSQSREYHSVLSSKSEEMTKSKSKSKKDRSSNRRTEKSRKDNSSVEEQELQIEHDRSRYEEEKAAEITQLEKEESQRSTDVDITPKASKDDHKHQVDSDEKLNLKMKEFQPTRHRNEEPLSRPRPEVINEVTMKEDKHAQEVNGIEKIDDRVTASNAYDDEVARFGEEDKDEEEELISRNEVHGSISKKKGRKSKVDLKKTLGRGNGDENMVREESEKGDDEMDDVEDRKDSPQQSKSSRSKIPRSKQEEADHTKSKSIVQTCKDQERKESSESGVEVYTGETAEGNTETLEEINTEPSSGVLEENNVMSAARESYNSDLPSTAQRGRRGRKRKGTKGLILEESQQNAVATDNEKDNDDAHGKVESGNFDEDVVEDVDNIKTPKGDTVENPYKDLKVVIEFMDTEKFQPLQERDGLGSKKTGGLRLKISRVKKKHVASLCDGGEAEGEASLTQSSDDEPLIKKKKRRCSNTSEEIEISNERNEEGDNLGVKSSTEDIARQTPEVSESGIQKSVAVEGDLSPTSPLKSKCSKEKSKQDTLSMNQVSARDYRKQNEDVAVEEIEIPTKRKGRPPKSKSSQDKGKHDTVSKDEEVEEAGKNRDDDVVEEDQNQTPTKRKGRPPKSKSSQDKGKQDTVSKDEDVEEAGKKREDDDVVEEDQNQTPTKRKGRPPKSKSSQDKGKHDTVSKEEDVEEAGKKREDDDVVEEDQNQTPTKRKGRLPKSKSSQDKGKHDTVSKDEEDKETGKKREDDDVVEEDQNQTPTKRKGRLPKSKSSQDKGKHDTVSKDEEDKETGKNRDENEEDQNQTPTRRKGRPTKSEDREAKSTKNEISKGNERKNKEPAKDEDVVEENEHKTPTKRKGRPPKSKGSKAKTAQNETSKDTEEENTELSKKQEMGDVEEEKNSTPKKRNGRLEKSDGDQAETIREKDIEEKEETEDKEQDELVAAEDENTTPTKRKGRPLKSKGSMVKPTQKTISKVSEEEENPDSCEEQDEDVPVEEVENQAPTKRRGRPPKSKSQSNSKDKEEVNSANVPEDNKDISLTETRDVVTSNRAETKTKDPEGQHVMEVLDLETGLLKTVAVAGADKEVQNEEKDDVSHKKSKSPRGRKSKQGRGNRFLKESEDDNSGNGKEDQPASDPEAGFSQACPEEDSQESNKDKKKKKDVQKDKNVPKKNQRAEDEAETALQDKSNNSEEDLQVENPDLDSKAPEDDFDLNNIVESIKKSLSERKSPAKDITTTLKISGTWPSLGVKGMSTTSSVGSFDPEWRAMFPWIYYHEENKAIFCKVCTMGQMKNIYTNGSHFLSLDPLLSHTESDDHVTAVTSNKGPSLLPADDSPEWQEKLQGRLSEMSAGNSLKRFNFDWLNKYKWLVYDEDEAKMFCKYCRKLDTPNMFKQGTRNFIKKHLTNHTKNRNHQEAVTAETAPAKKTKNNTEDINQLDTSDIFFSVETDETIEAEPLRWNRIADSVNHSGSDTDSSFTPKKIKRVPTYMSPVVRLQDVSQSPFIKSGRVDVKSVSDGIENLVPRKHCRPSSKSSEKQKKKATSFQSQFEMNIAKLSVLADDIAENKVRSSSVAESESSSSDDAFLVQYLHDDKTAAKPKSNEKLADKDIDSDILGMIPLVLEDSMDMGCSSPELSPNPSTSRVSKGDTSPWIPESVASINQTLKSSHKNEELLAEYLSSSGRKSSSKLKISAWKPVVVLSAIGKEDFGKKLSGMEQNISKETSRKRKAEDDSEVSDQESASTNSSKHQKDPAWITSRQSSTEIPEVLPKKLNSGKNFDTEDEVPTLSTSLGYSSDDGDGFVDLPDMGDGDPDAGETKQRSAETAAEPVEGTAVNKEMANEKEDKKPVKKSESKRRGRPPRKSQSKSISDAQSENACTGKKDIPKNIDEVEKSTPGKRKASAEPAKDDQSVDSAAAETKKRGRPCKNSKTKSSSDVQSEKACVDTEHLPKSTDEDEESTSGKPETSAETLKDVQSIEGTGAETKKRGRPSKKSKTTSSSDAQLERDLLESTNEGEESKSGKLETPKDVQVTHADSHVDADADVDPEERSVQISEPVSPDKSAENSNETIIVTKKRRGRAPKQRVSNAVLAEAEPKKSRKNSSSPKSAQRADASSVDEAYEAENKGNNNNKSSADDIDAFKTEKKSISARKLLKEKLGTTKDSDNVETQNEVAECKASEETLFEDVNKSKTEEAEKEPLFDEETRRNNKSVPKGKKRRGRPPKNAKSASPSNDEGTPESSPKKLRKKSPSPTPTTSADESDGGYDLMDLPDADDDDFISASKPDDKMDVGAGEASEILDTPEKVPETGKVSESQANIIEIVPYGTIPEASAKDSEAQQESQVTQQASADTDGRMKVGPKPKGKKGRGRPSRNAKTVSVVPSDIETDSTVENNPGPQARDNNVPQEHSSEDRQTNTDEQPSLGSESVWDTAKSLKHKSGSKSNESGISVNKPDFETTDISGDFAVSEQTFAKCGSTKTQEKSNKKKSPKIGPKCSKKFFGKQGETDLQQDHESIDTRCIAVEPVHKKSTKVRLGPKSVKERLQREELENNVRRDSEPSASEIDMDDLLNNLDLTEMMMCYISLKPLKSQ